MKVQLLTYLWARRSCIFSLTVPAQSVMASATLQQSTHILGAVAFPSVIATMLLISWRHRVGACTQCTMHVEETRLEPSAVLEDARALLSMRPEPAPAAECQKTCRRCPGF